MENYFEVIRQYVGRSSNRCIEKSRKLLNAGNKLSEIQQTNFYSWKYTCWAKIGRMWKS